MQKQFPYNVELTTENIKLPKLGFKVVPVQELLDESSGEYATVKCKPEEATGYSVYCTVQDGDLMIDQWVLDAATFEVAERFRSFLCSLCGMDNCTLLTGEILKGLPEDYTIGTGLCLNSKLHVGALRWIAYVLPSGKWTMRFHMREMGLDYIREHGDAITIEGVVRGLIPCTQDAWLMYDSLVAGG